MIKRQFIAAVLLSCLFTACSEDSSNQTTTQPTGDSSTQTTTQPSDGTSTPQDLINCTGEKPILCEGTCINPNRDKKYCGAKENCSDFDICDETENCVEGTCTPKSQELPACQGERSIRCEGNCINPKNDHDFCGAKNDCEGFTICNDDESCIDSTCTKNAQSTTKTCNEDNSVLCQNNCINPNNNHDFCGAKEGCKGYTACGTDENCVNGTCTKTTQPTTKNCGEGRVLCQNICVNPNVHPKYCGADENCQGYTTCGSDKECEDGACITPTVPPCPSEYPILCGNICINPQNDRKYCGATEGCKNAKSCTDSCVDGVCTTNSSTECLTFVDAELKKYIIGLFDYDENGCISPTEAKKVKELPVPYTASTIAVHFDKITSIADLQKFPNLTKINDGAFQHKTLDGDLISDSIEHIGSRAFYQAKIKTVKLPKVTGKRDYNNHATFGNEAFENTPIEVIDMPNLEITGWRGFALSKNAKTIKLPRLKTIRENAFYTLTADESYVNDRSKILTLFDGPAVETIETNAFYNAWVLKFNFPKVKKIESGAFDMVGSIEEFILTTEGNLKIDPKFISDNRVNYVSKCKLHLNSDKKADGSGTPKADGNTWPAGSNIKWGSIVYE